MSRRFGRNQRRRAREALAAAQEQIDNLECAHVMDRALLEHQSKTISEQREWLKRIAVAVGRQAVLAGEPANLGRAGFDGMRVVSGGLSDFDVSSPNIEPPIFMTAVMRLLEVEVIRKALSRQMHIHVALADKSVAYAISEDALYGLSRDELLRQITPRIAEQLVVSLRGAA